MSEEHAKLSASSAKKWLNCTPSVFMESEFPNTTSIYAREGTTAHSLGELKIRFAINEIDKKQYAQKVKALKGVDVDMERYTDDYRDFVIERFNTLKKETSDAILLLEQRLNFSDYVPEGFGTGDVVIIADGVMEIIDLKYGKGVVVSAVENPQLMLYALGALIEYDYMYNIENVLMTIFQPRTNNISSHTISTEDLYHWGIEIVTPKAVDAFKGIGECNVGKHCDEGFCRARAVCKAYNAKKLEILAYKFTEAKKMSNEDISKVLLQVDDITSWAKLVKEYALNQAVNKGVRYPGFKLVEGRSNRTYASEDEVISILKENGYIDKQIYDTKLKSITNMETLLSKKKFNDILGSYVIKPVGNPTLVIESDKRPELNTVSQAKEDFKSIISN